MSRRFVQRSPRSAKLLAAISLGSRYAERNLLRFVLMLGSLIGCRPTNHGAAPSGMGAVQQAAVYTSIAGAESPRSSWTKANSEQVQKLAALDRGSYVVFESRAGHFPIVGVGRSAPIVVSGTDLPGVQRAARDLQADIGKVSGRVPQLAIDVVPANTAQVILVGTLGKSALIDGLVSARKLDVSAIDGRWETHLVTLVNDPAPGVQQALIVVGSDQRGTIFGLYDVSHRIGISPWYFWDDVPAPHHDAIYVKPGQYSRGEPVVKYRGFFINDENPQLGRWARARFGDAPNAKHPHGFNHQLYGHVYEVLLRLRGNYLWPAVWSRSLFDDDPKNQALAAEYGIVMGTSHEAPMMRAQDEWNRYGSSSGPYGGTGDFSFVRNEAAVKKYWADGLRRMNGYESLVTIGMRGNGDTGMEDAAGTALMGRIVATQRTMLEEILGKAPKDVPQVWTLYKEVQDYWSEGMRAPDDVTVIWCDDNWGNMRGLPHQADPKRGGGYGLYYHFDYVGDGRNYKWVDTTLLPNLWEQLHLSYRYGVDRVWMTNVGDLKNDEHPLEFFLDYAWDPERLPLERLHEWEVNWARHAFGVEQAEIIAEVLTDYSRLQSRRKPELLNREIALDPQFDLAKSSEVKKAVIRRDASPFSLNHYREAERVVEEWRALRVKVESIRERIPERLADAFYQLVYYQIAASANIYELRLAQFRNIQYAAQRRAATNGMAILAQRHFDADRAMSEFYNTRLSGGKWAHWQTQPKLGYGGPYPNSSWQQPEKNNDATDDFIWPELVRIKLPVRAELAVAIDGSESIWPDTKEPARLPEFSPFQTQPRQYVEVINRGRQAFDYRAKVEVPWLKANPASGRVNEQLRVELTVDWPSVPVGHFEVPIVVEGANQERVTVTALVSNPGKDLPGFGGFVESNGVMAIEAENYDRSVAKSGTYWQRLAGIGRTAGGMTPFPVTADRQTPKSGTPRLEYDLYSFASGAVTVWTYLSPRNNVIPSDGLKYAISIDDEVPQIVNVTTALNAIPMNPSWERNTSDNVARLSTKHQLANPGRHVLKFWMVDPTLIVQRLIVDTGGLRPSYLGPPQSHRATVQSNLTGK